MQPEHKRNALLRLKTIRGHLNGLLGMVEDEVYCPDLMKQVAAVQASLEKVNRVLLQNHLETCVTEAIQAGGGQEKITELLEALRYNGGLTDFRHQATPISAADEPPAAVARGEDGYAEAPRGTTHRSRIGRGRARVSR